MSTERIALTPKSFRLSWIDRVMDAVERLPVPYWLVYLILFFLEAGLFNLIGWQGSWVKPYTLEPLNFLFPLWLWATLTFMTYLDGVAKQSLRTFAPLLEEDAETLACLEVEFTRMPAGLVLITNVVFVLIYMLMMAFTFKPFIQLYQLGPFAAWLAAITGLITFPIGGVLYYHTYRQLRLVSQTVKRVGRFDLFQLDPVYAFSRLTSQTGLIWLLMLTLTQLFFTTKLLSVVSVSLYIIMVLLAIVTLVLPLRSVHQRLVEEKRRLLAEANQRLESKLERLHRSLDADHLDEVATIREAVCILVDEREILVKIPTWPWRSTTFVGFVTALIFPIFLVVLQIILEKLIL